MPQDPAIPSRQTQDEIDIDSAIEQLRQKFKVPKVLLDKMVAQESGGNDSAVSPANARGRFQIMPATLAGISKETGKNLDINNPLDNAYAGLYLLNQNYNRFRPKAKSERGAWMMAVSGYHGNPDNVQRDLDAGGIGIPDQGDGLINTRDHVFSIFNGTKPEDFGDTQPSEVPKRPVVTSSVVEDIPELKPLTFESDDANEIGKAAGLNILARSAHGAQQAVSTAGVDRSSSPDVIGKRVPLTFDHPPTVEEVSDAFLIQHGYGEIAQRFKQETGWLLAGIEGLASTKTADGHYTVNLRPTKGSIDVINAYAKDGIEGVKAVLGEHQKQRIKLHNDVVMAGDASGLKGDAKKILVSQFLASAQLLENVNNLSKYGSREYDPTWKSATAISEARNRLPPTRTTVGSVAEIPVEAAGTVGRVAMFGPVGVAAFPVEQALEHAHEGPEGAAKAAILSLPMVAVGPIGKAVGADLMSPLARQLTMRGVGAVSMAETAVAQGATPKEILKEGLVGGMFPTGKRGIPERPIELGIGDIVHHSNLQPRTETGTFEKGAPLELPKLPEVEAGDTSTAEAFTNPERVLASQIASADRQLSLLRQAKGTTKKTAKLIRHTEAVKATLQSKLDALEQAGKQARGLGMRLSAAKKVSTLPSRETVEHADTISTAIESGNHAEVNKILDELGVTNADIETALKTARPTETTAEPVRQDATIETAQPPPRPDSAVERSFPKSLEEAGLLKGSDLYYNVKSHAETDAGAQRLIAERGEQQATLDVLQAQKLTPELVRTGQILIRRLDDAGKSVEADALAESLSRKGTEYGQVIDAFSMVEARTPKEIANYVERQVQKTQPDFRMTPEDRASMEVLAKDFQKFKDESGQIIADLQSRVGKLESKPPSRVAVKAAGLQARLDGAAEAARLRLKERADKTAAEKAEGIELRHAGIPIPVGDIADYAIIGAAKLAKGGLSIAQWTDEMASEFGDWVRDDFKRLYHESYKLYDGEKSADKTAAEARATEGMTPAEAKQKLRELSAARVNMRRARVEMQELYESMNRTPGERFMAGVVDSAGVPRALMSSGDLSEAFRQNSVFTLTEFKLAKQHAEKLFGSILDSKYQNLMSEIESNPEFLKVRDLMDVSFTSPELKRGHGLSSFDEYFPSQLAEKIPVVGVVVRASERAFTGPLDWARMTWGERFSKEIESYAAENDWSPERTTEALKQAGKFINAATGRGEFSGKAEALNKYLPFLNTVFFSPRYQLSRLQLLNMSLNPVAIMRMEAPVRKIVLRKMWRYYGTQAAIQVGAGAIGAQTNQTDPNSPDWLKLKIGNTRYDLNAGLQQNLRILYTMGGAFARLAAAEAKGNKQEIADAKQEVVGRGEYFLRSKLAPIPSFGVDYFQGSDINKQEFTLGSAVTKRLVPLYLQDMYEVWKEENGIGGAAKTVGKSVPAFFGVGVQTYPDRPSRQPPPRPSQSSVPARPQ